MSASARPKTKMATRPGDSCNVREVLLFLGSMVFHRYVDSFTIPLLLSLSSPGVQQHFSSPPLTLPLDPFIIVGTLEFEYGADSLKGRHHIHGQGRHEALQKQPRTSRKRRHGRGYLSGMPSLQFGEP